MRESDRETKRGDFSRHRHDQSHRRYLSPEERTNRGEGGQAGSQKLGGGGRERLDCESAEEERAGTGGSRTGQAAGLRAARRVLGTVDSAV